MKSYEASLLGSERIFSVLEEALERSPADSTELVLLADTTDVTRYANSEIHQNVSQQSIRIAVRVTMGRAKARVFTSSLDANELEVAIAQAVTLARLQSPNPNFSPLPAPDTGVSNSPSDVQCYFPATAELGAAGRAEGVGRIIESAAEAGFAAFGTFTTSTSELAVASTTGVRAYSPFTTAYLKALVEGPHGTGFSDAFDRDITRISVESVAGQAIAKCRANHSQVEIAPGEYEALFEPNAVADMVRFPVGWGMGARSFLDGQSFMSGKVGERVASEAVSIWDDRNDPRCLPLPFDFEGIPSVRVDTVKQGIAMGPVYDSETAAEAGTRSTGHATSPFTGFAEGPMANNIIMPAGTSSSDEMVGRVKDGVLVTRFHYTHCPDGKRVIATGTTRDGTFLIRDGQMVSALKNLRLEMGVLDLLSSLQEAGEGKLCQDWWSANGMSSTNYFVPSMRFGACRFTGVTTF